jgi:hypothetical protein
MEKTKNAHKILVEKPRHLEEREDGQIKLK